MKDRLLVGLWRFLLPVPSGIWRRRIAQQARRAAGSLGFMTRDHHRVRNLAVRELPRRGEPLTPEWIAGELELPVPRVVGILDELERRLLFLFRNPAGAVAWAYPATAEATPHRIAFSSGERGYAA